MAKTIYSNKRIFLSIQLIKAREQAGLTQKQVSEVGIVSQSELSKIENGQRKVEFLLILELAKFYSKTIDFFIPINDI